MVKKKSKKAREAERAKRAELEKLAQESTTAESSATENRASGSLGRLDEIDDLISFSDKLSKEVDDFGADGKHAAAQELNDARDDAPTDGTSYNKDEDPFVTPRKDQFSWKGGADGNAPKPEIATVAAHEGMGNDAEGSNESTALHPLIQLSSPPVSSFQAHVGQFGRSKNRPRSIIVQSEADQLSADQDTGYTIPNDISDEKPIGGELRTDKNAVSEEKENSKDGKLKRPEYNEVKRRDELMERLTNLTNVFSDLMEEHAEFLRNFFQTSESLGAMLLKGVSVDKKTRDWLQPEEFAKRMKAAMEHLDVVSDEVRGYMFDSQKENTEDIIDAEKREHELKVELDEVTGANRSDQEGRITHWDDLRSLGFQEDSKLIKGSKVSREVQTRRPSEELRRQRAQLHKDSFALLKDRAAPKNAGASRSGDKSPVVKVKKLQSPEPGKASAPSSALNEDEMVDSTRLSGGNDSFVSMMRPTRPGVSDLVINRASGATEIAPSHIDNDQDEEDEGEADAPQVAVSEGEPEATQSSGPSNRSSDTAPEPTKPEGLKWQAAPNFGSPKSRPGTMESAERIARRSRLSKMFTMPTPPTPIPELEEEENSALGGKAFELVIEQQVTKTKWRDLSWNWLLQKLKDQYIPWINLVNFIYLGLCAFAIFFKKCILHKLIGPPKHPNKPTLEPLRVPPVEDFITMAFHVSVFGLSLVALSVRKERMLWLAANAETREFLLDLVHESKGFWQRTWDLAGETVKESWVGLIAEVQTAWVVLKYKACGLSSSLGHNLLWPELCDLSEKSRKALGFALEVGKEVAEVAAELGDLTWGKVSYFSGKVASSLGMNAFLKWSRTDWSSAWQIWKAWIIVAWAGCKTAWAGVWYGLTFTWGFVGIGLTFIRSWVSVSWEWVASSSFFDKAAWAQGSGFTGFELAGLLIGVCAVAGLVQYLVHLSIEVYHTRINVW